MKTKVGSASGIWVLKKFAIMIRIFTLSLLALSLTGQLLSQSKKDLNQEVEHYFLSAQKGESLYFPKTNFASGKQSYILELSNQYLSDSNSFVRYKAIDLVKRTGLSSTDSVVRQKVVRLLVEACKDPDSGNSGVASSGLTQFVKSDFNVRAKQDLMGLINTRSAHYGRIIQIVGFVDPPGATVGLSELARADSLLSKEEKWFCQLALARLGSKESLRYCIAKVEALPINSHTVDFLFPQLAYTCQIEAFKFLEGVLMSDAKNCMSPNPDNETMIICSYEVMKIMAQYIKDFPVQVDKYGDLEEDDFESALAIARSWMRENKAYELNKDRF